MVWGRALWIPRSNARKREGVHIYVKKMKRKTMREFAAQQAELMLSLPDTVYDVFARK